MVGSALPPGRLYFYRGWWIVIAGFLSQMVTAGSTGWIFSVLLLPMQHSLGWSRSELVGVLTVSSLTGGTLSASLGPWVDRHGTRLLMTFSALLAGVCLTGIRFITTPWQYYLLMGLGFGLAMPGLQNLGPAVAIANWFVRRRSLAFTFFSFGSPVAGTLLAPAMAWLAYAFGWQTAWTVMGAFAWVVAPLAWLSVRRRPEDSGLLPDGARPGTMAGRPGLTPAQPLVAADEPAWTVGAALHTRSFWLLTVAFTLTTLPASSIFVHMTAYVGTKGFSTPVAVAALSIYGLSSLPGRFLWGFLIGRLGMHRALISFGFTYGLAIVAFLLPNTVAAIYLTTVFLGLSISGSQQLQAQAFPDYFGRRIVGALLGYAGLFFMLTRAAAPLFAAFVFDRTGSYTIAFSSFAVACLVSTLAFLLAPPPAYRSGGRMSAGPERGLARSTRA